VTKNKDRDAQRFHSVRLRRYLCALATVPLVGALAEPAFAQMRASSANCCSDSGPSAYANPVPIVPRAPAPSRPRYSPPVIINPWTPPTVALEQLKSLYQVRSSEGSAQDDEDLEERRAADAERRLREAERARDAARKAMLERDKVADAEEDERALERKKLWAAQRAQDILRLEITASLITTLDKDVELIQEFTSDQQRQYIGTPERAIETISTALLSSYDKKDGTLSAPPGLSDVATIGLEDVFTEAEAESFSPAKELTLGEFVKNKTIGYMADSFTQGIKDKISGLLRKTEDEVSPPSSETEKAYNDLWKEARVENLSKGIRPYLNTLVDKYIKFWGLATDEIQSKE